MAAWLLSLALLLAGHAHARADDVLTFTTAQVHLQPEGAPAWSGVVPLPHRWDKAFPGHAGQARYVLELPPVPADGVLRGLYFSRMGNQVEVYVGGDLLLSRGALGDSRHDATKTPQWVPVPARLLSASGPTRLEVRATMQPVRWGGLAPPSFGPAASLLPQYRERYVWRQWGAVGVVFALALTGAIAAGLWRLNRDPVYGYFALCAPFGILRHSERLWEAAPLGWPLWGAVMGFSFAMHALLMARFGLALMGWDDALVRRSFWALVGCEAVLVLGAFGLGSPAWWTGALALLIVPSLTVYFFAVHRALVERQPEAIALSVASLIPIGTGIYDFLWIRVAAEGADRSYFLPLVTLPFSLVAGWLILSRYARQMSAYQGLSLSLDEKVRQREQELQASYALLQHEHAQRAALVERQRIMRDIHDGVGSQLVGLLSLIGKGRTSRQQLREHANAALDELRMAVDAMQTVDGDLATVLATLRYRLQPRLAATGILVDWRVEELPALDGLTPHMVLQIQRILLEAFTNVLRHAHAGRVRVNARCQGEPQCTAPQLVLEIADDGVGLPGAGHGTGGQGLANMRARAQAIGAVLEITSTPGQGTCVRLALPAPGTPATPAPAPATPASRWP